MTTTIATRSISPDVDHALQRQLLVETCEQIAGDPRQDLIFILRERLTAHLGCTAIELHAVLLAAAWRNTDRLSAEIANVYDKAHDLDQHGATSGHDICCQGECSCLRGARHDRSRCDRCEAAPVDALDQAVRDLTWLLEQTVSSRAVNDHCGGAA